MCVCVFYAVFVRSPTRYLVDYAFCVVCLYVFILNICTRSQIFLICEPKTAEYTKIKQQKYSNRSCSVVVRCLSVELIVKKKKQKKKNRKEEEGKFIETGFKEEYERKLIHGWML